MKTSVFLKTTTVLNVVVATGFSVAGMINPAAILPANVSPDKAFTILALYAASRTIPLAAIALILTIGKRRDAFYTIACLAGAIQLLDGLIGIYQHDVSKSAGPFVIASVQLIALYLVAKSENKQEKIS